MSQMPPRSHAFVDESKVGGYYVVVTLLAPADIGRVRSAVRSLLLPGQKRMHFRDEKDSRRKQILGAFAELPMQAQVYIAQGVRDKEARPLCLEAMAKDLLKGGVERLCVERDESTEVADKRLLAAYLRDQPDAFRYDFLRASEEPLLWVPDAVAWCFQRGGHWKNRAQGMVTRTTRVG